MKKLPSLLALVALCSLSSLSAEERTWTSSDGREIKAEMIAYDLEAETVVIKTSRGEYTLPFAKISSDDQDFVRKVAAREAEERKKAAERAGKTIKEVTDAGHSFHVYYPTPYRPEKKPPLLILFSPSGGGEGILKNFRQGADALGWVLVGCDHLKNGMSDEEGKRIFEDQLAAIQERVMHDSDLLYMGGMSGGGLRAYQNSALFDRPWKGIISCGGWLGGQENYKMEYRKDMAVAIVNGNQDKNANHWAPSDSGVLQGRGCEVKLFSFPGGHVVGPPEVIEEAMRWVEENTETDE
jgi:hypothetical protein